ncbi:hypothetical protein PHJA_001151100 [Phtheirospermum japonicum]|uniref:Uncharacterized protein n=1 Tax=Phtheirospermum japonicum TaxID=374723 RepID=A0A830C1R1_9LAMI|nr:hypothetical protein PHJA_001151100 [Phtheirospermum japonicum]
MKVHPVPRKRSNITLRYGVASVLAQANGYRQKKLRCLPNIFAKVLELPFHSDADVSIHETPDSLRSPVATDDISGGVRADAIEIYPGVTKVVVRGDGVVDFPGTEFELYLWRFRLLASTRPELASAAYGDDELVVTVPKGAAAADGLFGFSGFQPMLGFFWGVTELNRNFTPFNANTTNKKKSYFFYFHVDEKPQN